MYPYGTNEMAEVGLTAAQSSKVRPPRVAQAKAALECTVYQILELPEDQSKRRTHIVVGRVVGIHVNEELIKDGKIDASKACYMSRLGYFDYAMTDSVVPLARPE